MTDEAPRRRRRTVPIPSAEQAIFPIQIRENVWVRVQGIPHDMTASEARKISRVILALGEDA